MPRKASRPASVGASSSTRSPVAPRCAFTVTGPRPSGATLTVSVRSPWGPVAKVAMGPASCWFSGAGAWRAALGALVWTVGAPGTRGAGAGPATAGADKAPEFFGSADADVGALASAGAFPPATAASVPAAAVPCAAASPVVLSGLAPTGVAAGRGPPDSCTADAEEAARGRAGVPASSAPSTAGAAVPRPLWAADAPRAGPASRVVPSTPVPADPGSTGAPTGIPDGRSSAPGRKEASAVLPEAAGTGVPELGLVAACAAGACATGGGGPGVRGADTSAVGASATGAGIAEAGTAAAGVAEAATGAGAAGAGSAGAGADAAPAGTGEAVPVVGPGTTGGPAGLGAATPPAWASLPGPWRSVARRSKPCCSVARTLPKEAPPSCAVVWLDPDDRTAGVAGVGAWLTRAFTMLLRRRRPVAGPARRLPRRPGTRQPVPEPGPRPGRCGGWS